MVNLIIYSKVPRSTGCLNSVKSFNPTTVLGLVAMKRQHGHDYSLQRFSLLLSRWEHGARRQGSASESAGGRKITATTGLV